MWDVSGSVPTVRTRVRERIKVKLGRETECGVRKRPEDFGPAARRTVSRDGDEGEHMVTKSTVSCWTVCDTSLKVFYVSSFEHLSNRRLRTSQSASL